MNRIILVLTTILLLTGNLDAQVLKTKVPVEVFDTVAIIYTANTHGLHAASQTDSPASARQTIIDELRKEYQNSLLVDLGDFMGATPTTILTKGKLDFQVMELLGYDLLHISNQEFITGVEGLDICIMESKIPVLSGNLIMTGSTAQKWSILSCGDRKVGFIGLTSPNFEEIVIENMRKDVTIESAAAYINEAISEMAGKADIIVALTDLSEAEIAPIRDIPGLDLIITTSDSSDWISMGFPGIKKAIVARTFSSGMAVHVLELHLVPDQEKWNVAEITGEVFTVTKSTPRQNAMDIWFQWQIDNYVKSKNKIIGELKETLSNEDGRTRQTELGKAVTNIMRSKSRSHLAILNSGMLRSDLNKGPITDWDMIEAIPYANYLVIKKLTGTQVEALISKSTSKSGEGGYLQFSGLATEPASLGNRVGGTKILPGRSYTVIMPNFLAEGGDGYDELKNTETIEKIFISVQDLCREALQKNGSLITKGLPLDSALNFWFAEFHLGANAYAFIANPDNLLLYPNQPALIGQQLVSGSLESRLDIIRMDLIFGFMNYIEIQYGLSFDDEWMPSTILDIIRGGTQFSLYLSNLLFDGVKTLDPYVSAVMETVMLFPDPTNEDPDPDLPRPSSAKLAGGLELFLFRILSIKLGIRWQNQPFNPDEPPITGLEGIVTLNTDIIKDIISVESMTEVFSAFDFDKEGITVSSINRIYVGFKNNFKLGPRIQLFYNTQVGQLAYFLDMTMTLDINL